MKLEQKKTKKKRYEWQPKRTHTKKIIFRLSNVPHMRKIEINDKKAGNMRLIMRANV